MSEPIEEPIYDRAAVKFNGEFYCLDTYSGYFGSWRDPAGKQYLLAPDCSDQELGARLLDCLSRSRVAKVEDAPDLYLDREEMVRHYREWVSALLAAYGYSTRRALFKNMLSCTVHRWRQGNIVIYPSNHDRLEGWSSEGLTAADNVVVPSASAAAEIGAALRLAFSRCLPRK